MDIGIKARRANTFTSLASLLMLAMLFCSGTTIKAQTTGQNGQDRHTTLPPQYQDNDTTRQEIADMDRFLDTHPEIAEQLRKDPSLIDNREWVANHPALQDYLQKHPEVREEIKENPNAFMRQEDRYERSENDRDHDRGMRTGDRDERSRYGDDDNGREMASFGQFLGAHSSMAAELSKDPSLANNKEYLASHPELDAYLKAHPMMSQQLAANPQAVMNSNWMQQQNGTTVVKPATPKEKPPNQ